jgi:hypothetical protein
VKVRLGDGGHAKLGVAYYGFQNVQGTALEHSSGTNTLHDDVLMYDYDAVNPSVELGFGMDSPVDYVGLFSDMVMTFDPDSQNIGYLGGVKFGAKKVKKLGQWQFKYMYRYLEHDAWIDAFPDSDAYGGATGVKGHEVGLELGLGKNSSLALDYYNMDPIDGGENQGVIQVDWNLKF